MFDVDATSVARIHESFTNRRLIIVVGAGLSVAAGLPNWDTLNRNLLSHYFGEAFSDPTPEDEAPVGAPRFSPEPEDMEELANILFEKFGKDAVVDLVKLELKNAGKQDADYHRILKSALYGEDKVYSLHPVHFELAASLGDIGKSRFVRFYTFNYDDLIERAMTRLTEIDEAKPIYEGQPNSPRSVVHLHGYFPDSAIEPRGTLILSERDYLDAPNDWADEQLHRIFRDDKDVLFLGLSLRDPRLRRLLHERHNASSSYEGEIFAILSTGEDAVHSEAPLMRRASRIANQLLPRYWRAWGVNLVHLKHHEFVPFVLRRIRLGDDSGQWAGLARKHLEDEGVFDEDLYSINRQAIASLYLEQQVGMLRSKFEALSHEELGVGVFVPEKTGEDGRVKAIKLAFQNSDAKWVEPTEVEYESTGKPKTVRIQRVTPEHAERRRLEIDNLESFHGAAGYAYVTGAVVNAEPDSRHIDLNFPPDMRKSWNENRTFSSLYCVPVLDSAHWVPVGVIYVTSSLRDSFWSRLPSDARLSLNTQLRAMFRNLLENKTEDPSHDKTQELV